MTYNVCGGTLRLNQSIINQLFIKIVTKYVCVAEHAAETAAERIIQAQ